MTFVLVDSDRCPACGSLGEQIAVKTLTPVLVCASCKTAFNEFGIIMQYPQEGM